MNFSLCVNMSGFAQTVTIILSMSYGYNIYKALYLILQGFLVIYFKLYFIL